MPESEACGVTTAISGRKIEFCKDVYCRVVFDPNGSKSCLGSGEDRPVACAVGGCC